MKYRLAIRLFLAFGPLLTIGSGASGAESILDRARPGTHVKMTTSTDVVSGKVVESTDAEFINIDVGSGKQVAVRRASVQTFRVLEDEAPGGVAASDRYVVYVHGICRHKAGFSEPWWNAMRPHVTGIPQDHVVEVLWSDIVNAPGAAPAGLSEEEQRLKKELQTILEDRAAQERDANAEEAPGGLFGEFFDCTDDFVKYMSREGIRNQILAEFDRKVKPLLEGGKQVEVISHSWGTVIAYEALRRMDAGPALSGRVHNLFTVGSALSIGTVRRNLRGRISGGGRPVAVDRWVNLDAEYDMVGGRIRGEFSVDVERLNLSAVDCSFFVTPTCAHSSYFVAENLVVNRDIFGFHISN